MKRFFYASGLSFLFSIGFSAWIINNEIIAFILSGLLFTLFAICAVLCFFIKESKLKAIMVILFFAAVGQGLWALEAKSYNDCMKMYNGKKLELVLQIVQEPKETKSGNIIYTARLAGKDALFKYNISFADSSGLNLDIYDYIRGEFTLSGQEGEYLNYNRSEMKAFFAILDTNGEYDAYKTTKKPLTYIFYTLKKAISTTIEKNLGKASGFIKALIIGDSSGINKSDYEVLKRAGLLHIASVSGQHVGILSGIILMFLSKLKNKLIKYSLCVCAIFTLAAICSFNPAVMRALIMSTITFSALIIGRKGSIENSFGISILLILGSSPFLIYSPSFLLSFAATFGIVALFKPLSRFFFTYIFIKFSYIPDIISRSLISYFILSLACIITTLPFSFLLFGEASLMGLFSNPLCMSAINIVFFLSIILLLLSPISLVFAVKHFIAFIINMGVNYIMFVSKFLSSASFFGFDLSKIDLSMFKADDIASYWWLFLLGMFLIALFFPFSKKKKSKRKKSAASTVIGLFALVFIALIIIVFGNKNNNPAEGEMKIGYLNIGQGSSSIILYNGQAVVADCGGTISPGEKAAQFLRINGATRISKIILSHLHSDHVNGLADLCDAYEVDEIIIPYTEGDTSLYVEITMIAAEHDIALNIIDSDQNFEIGDASFYILTNHLNPGASDQNENSLVIITQLGDFRAMFTGDITKASEKRLIEYYSDLSVNVLAVPHHGSKHSSSEVFLNQVNPELSIISAGLKNSYGHPAEEALARLINYGDILITKDCGNIELITNGITMDIYKEYK